MNKNLDLEHDFDNKSLLTCSSEMPRDLLENLDINNINILQRVDFNQAF